MLWNRPQVLMIGSISAGSAFASVGIGGEERGRDHVHLDVRTLGGEHHGDEQLKRIGKAQRGPRVGI